MFSKILFKTFCEKRTPCFIPEVSASYYGPKDYNHSNTWKIWQVTVRSGSRSYLPVITLGSEYLFWDQVWIHFFLILYFVSSLNWFLPKISVFVVLGPCTKLIRNKFGSFQPSFQRVGAERQASQLCSENSSATGSQGSELSS